MLCFVTALIQNKSSKDDINYSEHKHNTNTKHNR